MDCAVHEAMPTAVLGIIGNEILAGHTRDANIHFLTARLTAIGVRVLRIEILPDEIPVIVEFLRAWSPRCDYIFTSGGIGPTHDDVTREAVAQAAGRPLVHHPDAENALRGFYGADINAARLSMARVPEGADLVRNPVSAAPGFIVENIYVLPGIPVILQEMFESVAPQLRGVSLRIVEIPTSAEEGHFADWLADLDGEYPDVEIGSYPRLRDPLIRSVIRLSSPHRESLEQAEAAIRRRLESSGFRV